MPKQTARSRLAGTAPPPIQTVAVPTRSLTAGRTVVGAATQGTSSTACAIIFVCLRVVRMGLTQSELTVSALPCVTVQGAGMALTLIPRAASAPNVTLPRTQLAGMASQGLTIALANSAARTRTNSVGMAPSVRQPASAQCAKERAGMATKETHSITASVQPAHGKSAGMERCQLRRTIVSARRARTLSVAGTWEET